jgi:signal transduction histidine kinase
MIKKDELLQADKERYLSVIHDNIKKLSRLVEQLFQYAKLEANLVTAEKEQFLVNELVSDILMSYQLKASEKNIRLNIETPRSLPPVFADVALTERVFQNLLDNAFKFTPNGGTITIHLGETNAGIGVQVSDTGIGIAPEDRSYIFERYKQLSNQDTQKKGMGIGLAIVKKILELHQIPIEVISEQGKGTVFKFLLPLAEKLAM